ncbi:YceG family protein [Kurthia massiliensis]|uniref:YceG family protein n=1 Tax=Kurthia massiliensis TaxID=1033739 RepID=UPI0002899352|nr:YceG family protein [Kurthia massiliensis]
MNPFLITPVLREETTDWLTYFLAPTHERPHYKTSDEQLTFERIAVRVLGVPLDEVEYFNTLYEWHTGSEIHVLSEELDKRIDNQDFQLLQNILQKHRELPKGLSINRLVAMMYGAKLIPQHQDARLNRHLQLAVIDVIEQFQSQQTEGLLSNGFRRFLIDIVKWLKNHWIQWMETATPETPFPKVIWYGECTLSQQYFLLLLMKLGCDVAIFDPTGKDAFAAIDPEQTSSVIYDYGNTAPLQPFPTQIREVQATVGYRSTQQLERLIQDEQGIYRPWQYQHYEPHSVKLQHTYDDIFIYAKEPAMMRPGFKAQNPTVYIPTIFAKINGMSRDRADYWRRMHELLDLPHTLRIEKFPYAKESKANFRFHYEKSLVGGQLDAERMMQNDFWQYKDLTPEIQRAIALIIIDCCEQPSVQTLPGESNRELSITTLKQLSMLPKDILRMMQSFDYAQHIPKIIVYYDETLGQFSRADAILLSFLNRYGFDIIFYTPTGKQDIETYLDNEIYTLHRLDEMVFDKAFQERKKSASLIDKIRKRFFD